MQRRDFLRTLAAGAGAASLGLACRLTARDNAQRPNVVLMVGDDIGWSDIGCYGAEIETPNLDKMAETGVRFTQFYNMAKCNPTRSSLLTGLYLPRGNAKNAQAFPRLMQQAGYYTAMSGKEHFDGWVPRRCYSEGCFDDAFKYWAINPYFVPPDGKFKNAFKLNGEKVEAKDMPVTDPPWYKTDVVTNYALQFLDKAKASGKPFLLYLPYHAAHYPLQAREADIAKYRGKYKAGWDKIRAARFEKQKTLGVIAKDCKLCPPEDNINKHRGPYRDNIYKYRPWDTLPEKERDELDLEMAVFAAMIDRMDQNIGRVLSKLDELGASENTLVMFFSDNGSCPYDSNKDFSIPPGGPESYRTLCAAWANVGDTPFRFYKQYGHEGGSRTHFIARWPQAIQPGLQRAPAHLVDLYPTLLELAGAKYPVAMADGATPKLDGGSLLPLFRGGKRPVPEIIVSGYSNRFRMVRFGDWKIVKVNDGPWELYAIEDDPTELDDLAKKQPGKLDELVARYEAWRGPKKPAKKKQA